jgi:hypothetical protein
MLLAAQFVTSIAISLWGLAMIILGVIHAHPVWILLGLVVSVVGAPMVAANPMVAARLYPDSSRAWFARES